MIVVTTPTVEGRRIKRTIGLVKGNTARARIFLADWMAGLRNIIGGEVSEYTKLVAGSREQAVDRMIEQAEAQGANAIVGMQFTSLSLNVGTAEILAYGTAVELE